MSENWVVLVEAEGGPARGAIEPDAVRKLLQALEGGSYAGALYCPERYAVQVTVEGASPIEVLTDVVSRWAAAVHQLELPAWSLVRAEVFTVAELERQIESANRDEPVPGGPEPLDELTNHDDTGNELLRHAFSDALTGLLGSEAFTHRVALALQEDGNERETAIILLDVDGFERMNELCGRTIGDRVLIAIADRLTAMLRPEDLLARFGDDEFAIVFDDVSSHTALAVAERLVEAIRLPITIGGDDFFVSASAGVTISEAGDDAPTVIGRDQAALAAAKAAGGDRAVVHERDVSHCPDRGERGTTSPLQDRLAHLLLMQEAAIAANESDRLTEAAQAVMAQVCAHTRCAVGVLWRPAPAGLERPDRGPVWHFANGGEHGALQAAAEELLAGPAVDLRARVLATGSPVWITDLIDVADQRAGSPGEAGTFASAFAVPVLAGPRVAAVLTFFSRTRIEATDLFLDVLAGVGTQLGRVAERHEAVAALLRQEEELRTMLERLREAQALARLGAWGIDLRSSPPFWSAGMDTLLGLDPDHALDAVTDRVHPADRARVRRALLRMVATGEPAGEDVRLLLPGGEVRWHRCAARAITDDSGAVVAIQGTNQDITEQKLVEVRLRQAMGRQFDPERAPRAGWKLDLSTGRLTLSDQICGSP